MEASRQVVHWLRHGLPLKFSRKTVRERGLPQLSLHPNPSLVTQYACRDKQSVLEGMVNQLFIQEMYRGDGDDE